MEVRAISRIPPGALTRLAKPELSSQRGRNPLSSKQQSLWNIYRHTCLRRIEGRLRWIAPFKLYTDLCSSCYLFSKTDEYTADEENDSLNSYDSCCQQKKHKNHFPTLDYFFRNSLEPSSYIWNGTVIFVALICREIQFIDERRFCRLPASRYSIQNFSSEIVRTFTRANNNYYSPNTSRGLFLKYRYLFKK